MDYEITNTITPEEYLEMRALVGWGGFPLEQAKAGLEHTNPYLHFPKRCKIICIAAQGIAFRVRFFAIHEHL